MSLRVPREADPMHAGPDRVALCVMVPALLVEQPPLRCAARRESAPRGGAGAGHPSVSVATSWLASGMRRRRPATKRTCNQRVRRKSAGTLPRWRDRRGLRRVLRPCAGDRSMSSMRVSGPLAARRRRSTPSSSQVGKRCPPPGGLGFPASRQLGGRRAPPARPPRAVIAAAVGTWPMGVRTALRPCSSNTFTPEVSSFLIVYVNRTAFDATGRRLARTAGFDDGDQRSSIGLG